MAKKTQIQKFRETARKIGTHDSEKRFNEALETLVRNPKDPKPLDDLAEQLGQNDPNKDFDKPGK